MHYLKLWKESWITFKQYWKVFLPLYVIYYIIPHLATRIFEPKLNFDILLTDFLFELPELTIIALETIISSLAYVFLGLGTTYALIKKENDFLKIVKGAQKYYWRWMLLVITIALALLGLSLLLVIPALIFTVYWYFAPYFLIDQDLSVKNAMKASRKMVTGNWILAALYLLSITLVIAATTFLVAAVSNYFSPIRLFLIRDIINYSTGYLTTFILASFVSRLYVSLKSK